MGYTPVTDRKLNRLGSLSFMLERSLLNIEARVILRPCRVPPCGALEFTGNFCERTGVTCRGFILAMIGLLVAQFSPAGFMPAQARDGSLVIVICTGNGPVTRQVISLESAHAVHHGAGDAGDQDAAQIDKHCEFAAAAAAADVPQAPAIEAKPLLPAWQPPGVQPVLTGIFPRGLPPATGPPAAP